MVMCYVALNILKTASSSVITVITMEEVERSCVDCNRITMRNSYLMSKLNCMNSQTVSPSSFSNYL